MSQQLELLTETSSQWATVMFIAPEIQKKEIKPFVALALKELQGKPDSRTSSLMNADKFSAVRRIVRHAARLRSATREPWRADEVRAFLETLRLSSECVAELTALLCTDDIYREIPTHLRVRPGIVGVQWRIDLSLCQANMHSENPSPDRTKEILRRDTQVILILRLTDGSSEVCRFSVNKFQEFRYKVASALKSVIVLEKRKCMRSD